MKLRITSLLAGSAAAALLLSAGAAFAQTAPAAAPAAPAAPAPSPAPNPAMSATLSANPHPATFDAGPIGSLTVTGVISGGGFYQDNPQPDFHGNARDGYGDITSGLAMVQKTDGPVQFFVAGGVYSLAALGFGYTPAFDQSQNSFGYIPEGFVKIVPNSTWSIEVGQLPTLVGDEYTFSFQNINIQRGLLWSQENVFDKGVQVNYASGPLAVSVSWNDGFDSNQFNTVSGLVAYTFKNSDVLAFAASAPTGKVTASGDHPLQTPTIYDNEQIYNLIYTHSQGPWMISPYVQYTYVPNNSATGGSGSTIGGAILAKYSFTPEISVGGRVEYISSQGYQNLLGYGSKSSAWSVTVTPTYQKGIFFLRGELSYVGISGQSSGFGPNYPFSNVGGHGDQFRAAGEAGILF